jgi:hypothetical protein
MLVPGVTPNLDALGGGDFENDNFSANGQTGDRNQWNVDGASNQQSVGGGSGPQVRIPIDSTAEFQVLTHQYTAETGGSSGVIINAVTKSGTNRLSGVGFYYRQADWLAAKPFLLPEGEPKPKFGQHIAGFAVGGPIVQNKAFFFFNLDTIRQRSAYVHVFPAEATHVENYTAEEAIRRFATLLRLDYTLGNQGFRFTWAREPKPSIGQNHDCCQTLEHRQVEHSYGDRSYNFGWTSIFGSRATNELYVTKVGESRIVGNFVMADVPESEWFTNGWVDHEYIGPIHPTLDQFDYGMAHEYADFSAGQRDAHNGRISTLPAVRNIFTVAATNHTLKLGGTWDYRDGAPEYRGNFDNGRMDFLHNLPFDPADPFTYPSRFRMLLGNIVFDENDTFLNAFAHDQWRVNDRLTADLGLRWDYQDQTSNHKDAFSPRIGFAYDTTGSGRTLVKGGFGKFYAYYYLGTKILLKRNAVFSQTYTYDTRQDRSALQGAFPSHPCLRPVPDGELTAMSPECRALVGAVRTNLQPGGAEFINNEPLLNSDDLRMSYLWGFSAGVEHQLMSNLAIGLHYVGNRGRDQLREIDINEGPPDENGEATRLGAAGFDPNGTLIPASARHVDFGQVLQYTQSEDFNSTFDSVETTFEKRMSNNWSARVSYTLSYAKDVAERVSDDRNPRRDFGRGLEDNRHNFSAGFSVMPLPRLSLGTMFRAYSGYPVDEIIGEDVNGDGDENDRPCAGIHDLAMPIRSELDSQGCAARNGINGQGMRFLDLSLRYTVPLTGGQALAFYGDVFNILNTRNFGNPSGNRTADNFLIPVTTARQFEAQIGIKYSF